MGENEFNMNEQYMRRAMELASLGGKFVKSNPLVGCVIVKDNGIIGEGYHRIFGESHAEVNAINDALSHGHTIDKKCDFYVTLEPCAHYGKTPPCANLISSYNPGRVFYGALDHHPMTNGKGIEILEGSGVETILYPIAGISDLTGAFYINTIHQRPYVILKWAQTKDGVIGSSQQRLKITETACNRLVHKWRTEVDAILVGSNTVFVDNPLLTVRLVPGESPMRIILSSKAEKDFSKMNIFSQPPVTKILSTDQYLDANGLLDWNVLLNFLYSDLKICRLMIEGGEKTISSILATPYWDEVRQIVNCDKSLVGDILAPNFDNAPSHKKDILGNDMIFYYRNERNRHFN